MNALARVTIYEPTTIELEAARRRNAFRASIAAQAAVLAAPPPRHPSLPIIPPPHIPDTFYEPPDNVSGAISVSYIQRVVANHFEMSLTELLATRRQYYIVRARQMAIYLCRELTTRSMPEIGRRFGGMDHTTILHSCRRVAALVLADPDVAYDVCVLKRKLGWRP